MAPGFALILLAVFLAAIAPVVIALGIGAAFFVRARKLSAALLVGGAVGAGAGAILYALLALLSSGLRAWDGFFIFSAASLSLGALGWAVFVFFMPHVRARHAA